LSSPLQMRAIIPWNLFTTACSRRCAARTGRELSQRGSSPRSGSNPRWSRHRLRRLRPTWLRPDRFALCAQPAGVRLSSRPVRVRSLQPSQLHSRSMASLLWPVRNPHLIAIASVATPIGSPTVKGGHPWSPTVAALPHQIIEAALLGLPTGGLQLHDRLLAAQEKPCGLICAQPIILRHIIF
jgi:hypothetical protein